ncbi:cullin domain-containing protein [Cryptosporidium canis]|uniref:Cullin domain-containing protein n=1 Tax=Cryptosporidium canis TaxID=195482 RepID=A0ABQ8P9C9_9CRYT|nr:cullin domain-containing protein [Cryptosporidium canis]
MLVENDVNSGLCGPSDVCERSEVSDEVLEAWVVASVAAKSFVNDISRTLDEHIYSHQSYGQTQFGGEGVFSGLHPGKRLPESKLQLQRLLSVLEAPEVKDALGCIDRNDFSIQLLETFLGNSLDYVISREVAFFWTTLLLLGDADNLDSRMSSNDTSSVDEALGSSSSVRDGLKFAPAGGDALSFHCCLVFGLTRLLWNIVFVLYGAASLMNIPVQERSVFVQDYLSLREDESPKSMASIPLQRLMHSFMTKVRILIVDGIPPGFDGILGKYIFGVVGQLSGKVLVHEDLSIKSEMVPLNMRETILRILIEDSYGNVSGRVETCSIRLESLQHLYEHKSSKVLSLNGSFPSNLDFEIFESLLGLIVSNAVARGAERAGERGAGSECWGERRIWEVLGAISRGPMTEDLSKGVSEAPVETLSRAHVAILDELIWLVFCSDQEWDGGASDKCSRVSLMTRLGDLPVLMRLAGLESVWRQKVVSVFMAQSADAVLFLEKRDTDESNLRIFSKYIHEFMAPVLMGLLDGGFEYIKVQNPRFVDQEQSLEDNLCIRDFRAAFKARDGHEPVICDLSLQMILEEFYMEYNWSLKRRVIDMISGFPKSKGVILDLYITMNHFPSSDIFREAWYSEISREILNYVNERLLHLHVETSIIVGFYVKSILFLLLLDFPNDWIDKTLTGFGDALRLREGTTQCIVGWMPLMLENCSPVLADSDIVMPISCSDEGVYPQFSICDPNYRNECKGIFDKPFEQTCDYLQGFRSPQMKLVLNWISHIYGSNLTLLSDYIYNLASRVIGSWQGVGLEFSSTDGTSSGGIIDESTWQIDEARFQKDESVYEMIKMTIGGRSGEGLAKGGSTDSKIGAKDEKQLLTNCSIILQDIGGSISDNKEYNRLKMATRMSEDPKPTVTGFTISRNYWSEGVISMEIREDSFPLASVLEEEIGEYRQFFEREHPGRTFNCYSGYGVGLVDLTAMDGSVRSNVVMNFLQISIYDYISSRHPGGDLDAPGDGGSKDGFLDSDKLLSSNSILNWFSISPKASEKSVDPVEKSFEREEGGATVTFEDLLGHFGLDEQTVRWSLEDMLSRGLLRVVAEAGAGAGARSSERECFELPQSFSSVGAARGSADGEEPGRLRAVAAVQGQGQGCVAEGSGEDERFGSGVNDMTVMLDFNSLLSKRAGSASVGVLGRQSSGSPKKSLTLSDLVEATRIEASGYPEEVFCDRARRGDDGGFGGWQQVAERDRSADLDAQDEDEDEDEDLNLNFPTGIITTTISFKSKDFSFDARYNGSTASLDGASYSKLGENKSGSSAGGGNQPPMASFSETLQEKHCYFTAPVVLDEDSHGQDTSPGRSGPSREGEHSKYDIIRECELLIRATLQLNGAMAPAVLFGRVRTAIAAQSEGKAPGLDSADKSASGASQSPDTQQVLTWPQHVQAINNMVDRGEVYNKGGRLFLKGNSR